MKTLKTLTTLLKSLTGSLDGKKTYILSLALICIGVYLFVTGQIDQAKLIEIIGMAGLGSTLRHGIE